PGDRWSISNGVVYINGRRLHEPYVPARSRDHMSYAGGRVPKGRYFVLGDNRVMSCDSRIWGYVPVKNVIAHVVAIDRGGRTIRFATRGVPRERAAMRSAASSAISTSRIRAERRTISPSSAGS